MVVSGAFSASPLARSSYTGRVNRSPPSMTRLGVTRNPTLATPPNACRTSLSVVKRSKPDDPLFGVSSATLSPSS